MEWAYPTPTLCHDQTSSDAAGETRTRSNSRGRRRRRRRSNRGSATINEQAQLTPWIIIILNIKPSSPPPVIGGLQTLATRMDMLSLPRTCANRAIRKNQAPMCLSLPPQPISQDPKESGSFQNETSTVAVDCPQGMRARRCGGQSARRMPSEVASSALGRDTGAILPPKDTTPHRSAMIAKRRHDA